MLARAVAEDVFREAIAACDPARRVREALGARRPTIGLAIGKAALAMARGAGEVTRGLVVVPDLAELVDAEGPLPSGWRMIVSAHPQPDARSVAAADAAVELVSSASDRDTVLALISGGASSLVEQPRIPLSEFRAVIEALMRAGAPISDLNTVRTALSSIKGGQLALRSPAAVITLAVSDVIGDDLAVIGSGPTIGPWTAAPGIPIDVGAHHEARRQRAIAILAAHGLAIPHALALPVPSSIATRDDHAAVIAPMRSFADAAVAALSRRALAVELLEAPLAAPVAAVVERLAARATASAGKVLVAWGEPTLRVPDAHGEGGRAQQLALELARRLAGTPRCALVVGSDGIDGPPPAARPAPAGAFVDGGTWDAIVATGLDPFAALGRCDAGTALAAVGSLVITGATGINHADLVIVG